MVKSERWPWRLRFARIGQQCLDGLAELTGGMKVVRWSGARHKILIALSAFAVVVAIPLESGAELVAQPAIKLSDGGLVFVDGTGDKFSGGNWVRNIGARRERTINLSESVAKLATSDLAIAPSIDRKGPQDAKQSGNDSNRPADNISDKIGELLYYFFLGLVVSILPLSAAFRKNR